MKVLYFNKGSRLYGFMHIKNFGPISDSTKIDMTLVCDFIEAVSSQDESKLTSSIDASIESHVMGFRAEKSRLSNKKTKMPVSK